jgi:hypothetical protein
MVSVGFRVLGLYVVGLEFQGFRVCFVCFFKIGPTQGFENTGMDRGHI